MTNGERLHVGLQIALAIEALEARGVVHRDVHPRNIIVNARMRAVLIDFGMACLTADAHLSHVLEHKFLAPELLDGTPATIASDLSCGVVRANPALGHWNVDAIETVGCLRLAGAHPAERTHQLKRAVKNEPNKKPMEVHAPALRRTSAILDERIGLGSLLRDAVEVLIAGSAVRPRAECIASPLPS